MATQTSQLAIAIAAVSLIGGLIGIGKSCDDALDAKMEAKAKLLEAKQECTAKVEALNEKWHERVEK